MTPGSSIVSALDELGFGAAIRTITPLGGGCIADVQRIEMESGDSVVAKQSNDQCRLEEEADGLRALRLSDTVAVPDVLTVVDGALLLEYLHPGNPATTDWVIFGEQLAALHMRDVGEQYGWQIDNHLGDTLQPNQFHDDWVRFNQRCRFGPLRDILAERNLASNAELTALDRLIGGLGEVIPAQPHPALIHGDLWSGNALPTAENGIAIIDPAVSIGDGLADIAMMQLFGGFPRSCFDAYQHATGHDLSEPSHLRAIDCYRLYHVLNHWVLFGRGYAQQGLGLIEALCR